MTVLYSFDKHLLSVKHALGIVIEIKGKNKRETQALALGHPLEERGLKKKAENKKTTLKWDEHSCLRKSIQTSINII